MDFLPLRKKATRVSAVFLLPREPLLDQLLQIRIVTRKREDIGRGHVLYVYDLLFLVWALFNRHRAHRFDIGVDAVFAYDVTWFRKLCKLSRQRALKDNAACPLSVRSASNVISGFMAVSVFREKKVHHRIPQRIEVRFSSLGFVLCAPKARGGSHR